MAFNDIHPTITAIEDPVNEGEGYAPVRLMTGRGQVAFRFYPAPAGRAAGLWVGGVGGGWDTPARGLYPRLCRNLQGLGIASLRVRFRQPTDLDESVFDVLAGIAFLESRGVTAVALTGHSFGGAVVIQAAAIAPSVHAAIALATQGYGAEAALWLGGRCPLLLIHGRNDSVLPALCSKQVFGLAQEPKRLVLLDGAGHGLDEAAEQVYAEVRRWIMDWLLPS